MKSTNNFEMWTENGKYYYKDLGTLHTKEITKEEFEQILASETVTSVQLSGDTLGLSELMDQYIFHKKNKTSEFGSRVKVVIVEGEQTKSHTGVGVDVSFKLDVISENPKKEIEGLYTIQAEIEGVTGSFTDRGVYFPELYRATYQLAFNGYLATYEELKAVKRAVGDDE